MGGITSDGDDGEEAEWARERNEQKVGRNLGNLSKADDFRFDLAYLS